MMGLAVDTACLVQIYTSELESQPEFGGFSEWLHTFPLYRGKKMGEADEDSRTVGFFKVGRQGHGRRRTQTRPPELS